jgi:hypothetical protein
MRKFWRKPKVSQEPVPARIVEEIQHKYLASGQDDDSGGWARCFCSRPFTGETEADAVKNLNTHIRRLSGAPWIRRDPMSDRNLGQIKGTFKGVRREA